MTRRDTKKSIPATSSELEKKRKEFQEKIAHKKKPTSVRTAPVRVSRRRLFVGLGLALVLLVGLSAAAVYALWYKNPEKAVSDAMFRALMSETITYTGTLTSGQTVDAQFNGAVAGAKGSKLTFNTTLNYDNKEHTFGTDAIFDREGTLYLGAGGIQYALGNDLVKDAVNTGTYSNELAKKLDGKWLKVSSDQLMPYSRKIAAAQSCVETLVRKNQADGPLFAPVADIYKRHTFVRVTETLGTVDGSTGYSVSIDSEIFKAFLMEFKETNIYKQLHDCDSATFELNPDTFIKGLVGTNIRVQNMQLWINNQHDITKIVLDGTSSGLRGEMIVVPQFDQEVKIVTPTNIVTLEELHGYMQEGTEALMLSKESDAASQQKLKQLIDKVLTLQ